MSKPSLTKLEITDRIVEKLGYRDKQGVSTDLTRLSIPTLRWLEEGIDLLKKEKSIKEIESMAKKLAEKYRPTFKISAIKELRDLVGQDYGLKEAKEAKEAIERYW